MTLTDTGPHVALMNRNDPYHAAGLRAAAGLRRVFTFDGHFRVYRLADGSVLELVP